MTRAFLDTGYLIALETSDDQHHPAAQAHWRTFRRTPFELTTTSFVFDEAVTFFNSRGHHAKAVQVGHALAGSPRIRLVHVDRALFEAGWAYFCQRPDKRYSLTDCISFMVMEREGLRNALCFDAHFEQAGFARVP